MLTEGTLAGFGLWDPLPSPPCRGPPPMAREDAARMGADSERHQVPFPEDASYADYGAGDGDFWD